MRHGFISLHFLQHIHKRDVGQGRADGFWRDQFLICTNPFTAPLWIGGLLSYLRERRYRMLAWMYLIPLGLFVLGQGRGYYLGGAYPMLMAMGAVVCGAGWVTSLSKLPRRAVEGVFFAGLVAVCGAFYMSAVVIPWAASGPLMRFRSQEQWRSARGNWLGRISAGSGGRARLVASGAAADLGRDGEELWGTRRHRDFRPRLPAASADQRNELGVAAWIPRAAAIYTDRARNISR